MIGLGLGLAMYGIKQSLQCVPIYLVSCIVTSRLLSVTSSTLAAPNSAVKRLARPIAHLDYLLEMGRCQNFKIDMIFSK